MANTSLRVCFGYNFLSDVFASRLGRQGRYLAGVSLRPYRDAAGSEELMLQKYIDGASKSGDAEVKSLSGRGSR